MIQKKLYATEEELRELEIRTANDYVGYIIKAMWINWYGKYQVTIEFDSKEELKQFCDVYGYKINRVNKDFLLAKREG